MNILLLIFAAFAISPSFASNVGADIEKRQAVIDAFNYNYENYIQYAYPQDCIDLKELKGTNDPSTAGFGGTPIEALSTMIMMNMSQSENYKNALKVIQNQTFQNSNSSWVDPPVQGTVKLYELTVNLIGGMLSAFQMNGEKPEEAFIVNKTKALADRIKGSWVDGAKIPVSVWNMNNQSAYDIKADTNLAEAGTLTLELNQLSSYSKDKEYINLAEGSVNALLTLPQFFPGLPFTDVQPKDLTSDSKYVTVGGGTDGYIAYLLKYPLMLGKVDHPYIKTWLNAVESIKTNLTVKSGVHNLTFTADYDANKNTTVNLSSELACFIGGNVALGGRLLGRDDLTTLGLEFTESCAATYDATVLGLPPYGFGYADKNGNFTGWNYVSKQQRQYYNDHGIFVEVGYFFLQYEIIESIFYAWRITGDQMWRDLAWKFFQKIKKVTDTGHGWATIDNVNDESTGIENAQPVYLYSALLTYFYLIFDDFEKYSLDQIVFTKGGFPFKRQNSQSFKKVQGNFPYTPLYYSSGNGEAGKSDYLASANKLVVQSSSGKVLASLNEGNKPSNLFQAKAGEGKVAFMKQLTSHTEMSKQAAKNFLAALKKH